MAPPTPPLIATTAQRRRQFLLQHRFNEAADAAAQTRFDRVEPGVTRKQPLGALSSTLAIWGQITRHGRGRMRWLGAGGSAVFGCLIWCATWKNPERPRF